jgi:poly-gamma-glutamate synthase PgsB/CapB
MLIVLVLAVLFFAYGLLEHRLHLRNLRAIPIRVHVNGTRGKSSVTRLIAAGLRAGGIPTVAKTTGSAARYIHADGAEEPVSRPGPANIKEQLGVVARARREGARALVLECMAIRPDLQWVTEHMITKATVGVITNVRPDHLDVMGPTVDDVATALASTVPRSGALFTAEHGRLGPMEEAASAAGIPLHEVAEDAYGADVAGGFSYVEHRDNIALSLAVCEHLGVPKDVALSGMREACPDPGALTVLRVTERGKEIEFVNAFAANDRESTVAVWNAVAPSSVPGRTVIAVASMRADRPDRAYQFGEILADDIDADYYILTGHLTHPTKSVALSRGLPPEKLVDLSGWNAEDIFEEIVKLTFERSIVVGMGNIGGTGGELVSLFRERSRLT